MHLKFLKFFYFFLCLAFLVSFFKPNTTSAAVNFEANFSAGLSANQASGDNTAYNDGTFPPIINTSQGKAIQNTYGTTLKYKTSNLNQAKDSVSFNFQMPFDLEGDRGQGRLYSGDHVPSKGISYDYATSYLYITDLVDGKIIRTKIDGTGWETFGHLGSGQGEFNQPSAIYFDSASQFLYVADSGNSRIVKTKFDGTGWQTYGEGTIDPNNLNPGYFSILYEFMTGIYYDYNSGFIYISQLDRVIKTKIDGTGWQVYGTYGTDVGQFAWITGISYDYQSDLIYVADSDNNRIVRTKIDGTDWETYNPGVSRVWGLSYDQNEDDLYFVDTNNQIIKTKFGGADFQAFGEFGYTGVGKFHFDYGATITYDSASGYVFLACTQQKYGSSAVINRTKLDGSWTGWAEYGSQGNGNDLGLFKYDVTTGNFYKSGYSYSSINIVQSKKDGSDWDILGQRGLDLEQTSDVGGLDYDPSSQDIYAAFWYQNDIARFKMDGTGWQKFDAHTRPTSLTYDPSSGYIYYSASQNQSFVYRMKNDGTGYEQLDTSLGSGDWQFNFNFTQEEIKYDSINDLVYVLDIGNNRIVKFKWDKSSWETYALSADPTIYTTSFDIDPATGFMYLLETDVSDVNDIKSQLVKTKFGGSDRSTLNIGNNMLYPLHLQYVPSEDRVYFTDPSQSHPGISTVKLDGTDFKTYDFWPEKTLFRTSGDNPMELDVNAYDGKFYFSMGKYELPISRSVAQTLAKDSWHDVKIDYDYTAGTADIYLDDSSVPLISQTGLNLGDGGAGGFLGDYFYLGSDPDPNRTFPGAITNFQIGSVENTGMNNTATLTELPQTGADLKLSTVLINFIKQYVLK